jgi:hypothetical protein
VVDRVGLARASGRRARTNEFINLGKTMRNAIPILLMLCCIKLYPCSIFKYSSNSEIFFCGNEDWITTDPAIITIPANKNDFGVVLLGWKSYLPNYPQAGINSEGLCFDWAMVPKQNYKSNVDLVDLDINSTIDILKKCKSVNEVIEYLKQYDFSHIAEEHIMFTDKTGASCVIEYTKGERHFLINNSETQYITNFNLTDKSYGGYPCDRYTKLERGLKKEKLDIEDMKRLLSSVHQEGTYPTIYSYIFDLRKMNIRLFYNHRYDTYKEFTINGLLKKKQIMLIN